MHEFGGCESMFEKIGSGILGANLLYTAETTSTNDEMKLLAENGAPEGTVYMTDYQTAGKGRMGRTWLASPCSSLLFSVLFRPENLPLERVSWLGSICALSMIDAVRTIAGVYLWIKWPNDLIAEEGKKIAGMLMESKLATGHYDWVVVGLGLNVNLDPEKDFAGCGEVMPDFQSGEKLPPEFTATSLSVLLRKDTSNFRHDILKMFLVNLEERYLELKSGYYPSGDYHENLSGVGQYARIFSITGDLVAQGVIQGADNNGALELIQTDGSIQTVLSGDITLRDKVTSTG